ncbi:beta-ketoacyl synthase chain length factor [Arcicella sp. LKC2W]|uniref:beta-ketoacyl synthase chain length factor n=1 Tax=Arcicella sp. LKC2W TaxID=2984198 RepID=UPI002B21A0D4|nr:beta-ketoacyl synthase chain length factor [Arcicella sp. LKC2W]MEA5460851.1 beta-ketoacyl synthase chain length factor [Arcicella sp. LKC2W]
MKAYINSIHCMAAQEVVGNTSFKITDPNFAEVLGNSGELRRMSRLVKLGMYASQKCIHETATEQVDAILVGTGLGGIESSDKFLVPLLENENATHSPTPFIQSLPNSIAGQIALKLKCYGYNMTYVHRGFSFESALMDALMLMEENLENKNILVGGLDELVDSYIIQMRKAGYLKDKTEDLGVVLGEGATFLQISSEPNTQTQAVLRDLRMLYRPENDTEIIDEIYHILNDNTLEINDIDFVLMGSCGDKNLDAKLKNISDNQFANHSKMNFKEQCGEYYTSSGYALWQAVQLLNNTSSLFDEVPKAVNNVLIINHYNDINYSIFLISKP